MRQVGDHTDWSFSYIFPQSFLVFYTSHPHPARLPKRQSYLLIQVILGLVSSVSLVHLAEHPAHSEYCAYVTIHSSVSGMSSMCNHRHLCLSLWSPHCAHTYVNFLDIANDYSITVFSNGKLSTVALLLGTLF